MPCVAAIDADVEMLDLYEQLLADAGYDTLLCPDATTAYEQIRDAEPDAIILDLRLSTDDAGWAVLRSLKDDARLCETPVIVCMADPRVVQRCADDLQGLGCSVLTKPFDINALLALLRQVVEADARAHPAQDARRRLDQLHQQAEQHLQRARAGQAGRRAASGGQADYRRDLRRRAARSRRSVVAGRTAYDVRCRAARHSDVTAPEQPSARTRRPCGATRRYRTAWRDRRSNSTSCS
jgi:DNA-binding NtrC family response regulator